MDLTTKHQQLFDYLEEHLHKNGKVPSLRHWWPEQGGWHVSVPENQQHCAHAFQKDE